MTDVRRAASSALAVLMLTACTGPPRDRSTDPPTDPPTAPSTVLAPTATSSAARPLTPSAPPTPAPATPATPATPTSSTPTARPADVDVRTAVRAVRHLAGRIGPRAATGPAYRRAAGWVSARMRGLGYRVRDQSFPVPGGVSWGVPVPSGRSTNLVATPAGLDRTRPHLLVGAHLDTVPQAPGAEDNASGIGVLLAVAEAVAGHRTRLPVVLVAFGAEEPRGPTDDDHHYGSRHFVSRLGPAERRAVRGMVALDRVGVGAVLPVCSAGGPDRLRTALLAAARAAGVPTRPCTGNRVSDHWSFVRAGLPAVRLGSTPYAGYHSPGDVPAVVERAQLRRAARTVVAWVAGS
jgi:aminopeptidase YwaD